MNRRRFLALTTGGVAAAALTPSPTAAARVPLGDLIQDHMVLPPGRTVHRVYPTLWGNAVAVRVEGPGALTYVASPWAVKIRMWRESRFVVLGNGVGEIIAPEESIITLHRRDVPAQVFFSEGCVALDRMVDPRQIVFARA